MKFGKGLVAALALCGATLTLASCSSDADVASDNLSKEAEQFKVLRRVVFLNGITDKYIMTIEGYCSIEDEGDQLEVICKVGDGKLKKEFLGLSDNVTYFVQQLDPTNVSTTHYKVIFKPEVLLPDIDRP